MNETPATIKSELKVVSVSAGKIDHTDELLEDKRERGLSPICRNLLPIKRKHNLRQENGRKENGRNHKGTCTEEESKDINEKKGETVLQEESDKNDGFEILSTETPSPPKRQKYETISQSHLPDSCCKQLYVKSLADGKLCMEDDLSVETLEDILLSDLPTNIGGCSDNIHEIKLHRNVDEKKLERQTVTKGTSRSVHSKQVKSSDFDLNEDMAGDSENEKNMTQFTNRTMDKDLQKSFSQENHHKHRCKDQTVDYEKSMNLFRDESSAYVQNLAEICYTIMNDRRWSMKSTGKQLFAWENGDDLSAIHTLSSLYKPKMREEHCISQCICILCRDSSIVTTATECTEILTALDEDELTENDDRSKDKCRALNLYCRLYYRKGPWFRLDDIFRRYYAPKLPKKEIIQEERENNNKTFESPVIDEVLLKRSINNLSELLHDVQLLCSSGLLRTFEDEEECGKISGSVGIGGNGVLLSNDERCTVLRKLGGSSKKGAVGRDKRNLTAMPKKENAILRQMQQQRSIMSGMFSNHAIRESKNVLPVRRHVDNEVSTKLLAAVVSSATSGGYLPASIFRMKVAEVKKEINIIISRQDGHYCNFDKLETSYRLREAPLLTLRRCCRLYLCATCGPGNMRGDGKNGWKSVREFCVDDSTLPLNPPGDITWHSITYPGLSQRLGMSQFYFLDAYRELRSDDTSEDNSVKGQVFPNLDSFKLWELAVEIRANADYLCEVNELILYQERRKAREEGSKNMPSSSSLGISDQKGVLRVDFLNVLQKSTRRWLIFQFCSAMKRGDNDTIEYLISDVESEIVTAFAVCNEKTLGETRFEKVHFHTDCEKVLFALAIIIMHLLEFRFKHVDKEEKVHKKKMCWLRHMWWEGVLAYVLWDCIPILEKRQLYESASKALEVLAFGSFQTKTRRSLLQTKNIDSLGSWGNITGKTYFGDIMISRRARGKAIERLLIDYMHMFRQESKIGVKINKKSDASNYARNIEVLCSRVLEIGLKTAFISFSSMRRIAKKTKRPLNHLLGKEGCTEANLLGLRLLNTHDKEQKTKGYVDWIPKTDQTVAVALKGLQPSVGTRCSYVGFEDGLPDVSSLNVEELAMEYYATGRLPVANDHLSGGSWVGWHDEGSRLRSLFRLLCACPILGMDGDCGSKSSNSLSEQHTVHLTRYQSAPFDLHVGSWSNLSDGEEMQSVHGFYNRRIDTIDAFLAKLETLTSQDLSDCVFEAVEKITKSSSSLNTYNNLLNRDIQQVRSLSMLAVGFGGKMLAAAFRCMLFDYRHYSGGLPDLLLVRAFFSDSIETDREFVSLREWIGEECLEEKRSMMLVEEDEEFLGCSKVGDSGTARSSNKWKSRQSRNGIKSKTEDVQRKLPEKLQLCYEARPVQIQCMFVEVKSQNDRLDARQEDWLNILDRFGNARVCKFVSEKKKTNRN